MPSGSQLIEKMGGCHKRYISSLLIALLVYFKNSSNSGTKEGVRHFQMGLNYFKKRVSSPRMMDYKRDKILASMAFRIPLNAIADDRANY
jgi:hypothetical protein